MLWLVGLIFLVFLFYRSTATTTAQELRQKLKQKGCIPELYTFTRFQQANAVYAKMMLPTFKNGFAQFNNQQSIMYIGSTRLKPAQREFNRQAKIKQLTRGPLPKVELAIRDWVDNSNYDRFITLALGGYSGYRDAWAAERSTIQSWQARLNHPTHSESSYSRKCADAYINIVLKNLDYYLSFLRCGLYYMTYRQTHSRSSRPANSFAAAGFHQKLDWSCTDLPTTWNNPGGPSAQQG